MSASLSTVEIILAEHRSETSETALKYAAARQGVGVAALGTEPVRKGIEAPEDTVPP